MNILKSIILMAIAWIALHTAIKSGVPYIGKLPGDLHFHGDKWEVRIPVVTCLAISAILFVVSFIFSKFRG